MDRPKPFPILRLLRLEEVFKAMDPFEIINFSMISKRANNLVSCVYEIRSGQQMVEKTAEGDGSISRRVFKYLEKIFKKPAINGLPITVDASVDFFFIAPLPHSVSPDCSFKMDRPKPFPILRLPFLALEEVFKAMDPIEIINISMTSKRAKAVTKNMTFYSKYAICLCVDKAMEIAINGTNNLVSCTYLMTSNKLMEGKTVEHESGGYISRMVYKYSEDPVDEWKQLCEYILEIFGKPSIED